MWLATIAVLTGSSVQARLIGVIVAPGPTPLTRMPRRGVLERERPGQVLHPALADAVAEVARPGDQLVDARDVDHDARLLVGQESLDRLAGAQERAAQVDREHLVELGARELLGRPGDLDAGVVDEDVEAAEALARLADHAHDVLLGGDVALDEHVADAVLAHLPQAGVHLLLGPGRLVGRGQVVDRDVGAVLGEPHGGRLADPGGAAGDQDVLARRPGIPARRSLGSTAGCGRRLRPRGSSAGRLAHGRPPSADRAASSAAPNTRCEVDSHATAAGASRHGGRWMPSAGRGRAVGARVDREPGQRAPAAARRGPAARGGS